MSGASLVRHKRYFGPNDSKALLEAIGACRTACLTALKTAPIGDPVYRAASRLVDEVDLVAEVLTGHRNWFHLRPPTAFGVEPPDEAPPHRQQAREPKE